MSGTERQTRIKAVLERAVRYLELRPEKGRRTAVTEASLTDGLRCEITEGEFQIVADFPPKAGGDGAGPNPGMLGRGALAACVAMNVAMRAALLQVPIEGVKVRVEAHFDARGEYIPGAANPGYSRMRVDVTIRSNASETDIARVLEEAQTTTSFLSNFRRPIDVAVETHVIRSIDEEAA